MQQTDGPGPDGWKFSASKRTAAVHCPTVCTAGVKNSHTSASVLRKNVTRGLRSHTRRVAVASSGQGSASVALPAGDQPRAPVMAAAGRLTRSCPVLVPVARSRNRTLTATPEGCHAAGVAGRARAPRWEKRFSHQHKNLFRIGAYDAYEPIGILYVDYNTISYFL